MGQRITFLRQDSRAWDAAWQLLAHHPVNRGLSAFPKSEGPRVAYNVDAGEAWQYMGTIDGGHEFRHRCHPCTGRREVVRLR